MDGCVSDALAPAGVDNERRRQDGHAADGTDKKFIDCPAATDAAAASDVGRDEVDSKSRVTRAELEAASYLEYHHIGELFGFLMAHLVADQPSDPVAYLFDLLDKCLLFRDGLVEPPLLFAPRHIESMYNSLDPAGVGHISLSQYAVGMKTLGIDRFNACPMTDGHCDRVDKDTFLREAGGGGKGVRPVYLRCSRGTVSWRYPRGALRVVLSGGESNSRGFRGCVKASGPARVYLEGKTSLRLLYSATDGKHEALHRCFRSRGPIAALYVEADEQAANGKAKVRLHYDLELQQRIEPEEEAECRPCSKEELAEAYCRSDLVARGTVSAVERRPELESAELVLRLTKTLRRVDENEENELDSGLETRATREVRIRVPTACDAHHGQGEFVIMAKKRLGDLTLSCAPRLDEWAQAVREMESAPCVLKS